MLDEDDLHFVFPGRFDQADIPVHKGFRVVQFPVLRQGFLLLIAVPKEDTVIQGDAQLEHGGNGLGDIADFSEKVIAPTGHISAQALQPVHSSPIHLILTINHPFNF